uniref:Putative methyltransferase n=1 Tax=viral metagenome TaxID=1070528 RepID=A0A6M3LZ03_9ZZZZ
MIKLNNFTVRGKSFSLLADPESRQVCQQDLCKGKIWEPWLTDYILDNLEEDSTFIDAGASVGWFTFLAAAHCPQGRIVAFEPHPKRFNMMKTSLEGNNFKNIDLIQTAVSDIEGYSTLGGRAEAQMDEPGIAIDTTTIDLIVEVLHLSPDIVKLDVEGAEIRALHGMKKTLKTENLKLAIEVHPSLITKYGDATEDLYNLLNQYGFKSRQLYGNYKVFER